MNLFNYIKTDNNEGSISPIAKEDLEEEKQSI